jgi:VanZ family protein
MKARRLVSKWMPVIAWMLLIFAGSSDALSAEHTSRFLLPFLRWLDPHISIATIMAIHFTLRKFAHFSEYAILAALLWRALYGTFTTMSRGMLASTAFFVAAAFAAFDEFHQSFVPSRTASSYDVMIDCTGALVAVLICLVCVRKTLLPAPDRQAKT